MKRISSPYAHFAMRMCITVVSILLELSQSACSEKIRRVACIGNSITYGAGISDRSKNSYPAQLQKMLGSSWDVRNFGSSGRTLLRKGDYPYWKEKEFSDAKAFNPDVVIIKLGTNDSKPQNWKYKDEFIGDYEEFIEEFKQLPSHPHIYVCTPVPAFPGDWGISDSVIRSEVIPPVQKVAAAKLVPVIDLYSALAGKGEFFPDKVHPDEEGARLMALTIYEKVCRDFAVTPAPRPFGPVPAIRQLARQETELSGFFHFSMNTFTDREWGYGDEPESLFAPTGFDADKIVRVAKDAGMKGIILTCKHHDGFCLWPTRTTEHSVKKSPWKNGTGDVVKDFAEACRHHEMKFGVYLSPWDRNNKEYGRPEYLDIYRTQLTELLTNYGDISEVWFDGANGGDGYYGGARETRIIDRKSYYHWPETWDLVRRLQPNAVIFSDGGPGVRWVGDEDGFAGETNWSLLRRDEVFPGYENYKELISGHPDGTQWVPAECDVSIRPGWFYHAREDSLVKSADALYELYFQSVGRNASLLLNVPPDRRGLLNDHDVKALMEFKKMRDASFQTDLAKLGSLSASNVRGNDHRFSAANINDDDPDSYWSTDDGVTHADIVIAFDRPVGFNCLMLQEYIALGQRVEEFSLEAWHEGKWDAIAKGTTIGYKRLLRFPKCASTKLRLKIVRSRACPAISRFALYDTSLPVK